MKIRRSKRAEILSQLLPYITTDNYDHQGRFWIFGAQSFWEAYSEIATPEDKQEDTSVSDAAIELANDAKHHAGRTQLAARASLSAAPRFKTNATKSLTPEQLLELRIALEKVVPDLPTPPGNPVESTGFDHEDDLDAAFAKEFLDKLSKTVQRAAGLDKMELDSEEVGAKIVGYFNEAHRCYLYGFNVACAVLCRAIIESSLAQVCDPLQHIKNSLERGESHFMNLIKAATSKGLLKDDRPGWADNIRKAGGYAIHDLDAFMEKSPLDKKSWNDRVPDLLLNTRKVLLDLYRDQTTV